MVGSSPKFEKGGSGGCPIFEKGLSETSGISEDIRWFRDSRGPNPSRVCCTWHPWAISTRPGRWWTSLPYRPLNRGGFYPVPVGLHAWSWLGRAIKRCCVSQLPGLKRSPVRACGAHTNIISGGGSGLVRSIGLPTLLGFRVESCIFPRAVDRGL